MKDFVTNAMAFDLNKLREKSALNKASLLTGGVLCYMARKGILPSRIGIRPDVPINTPQERTVIFAEGIEFVGLGMILVGLINAISGQDSGLIKDGIGVFGMGKVAALAANAATIAGNRRRLNCTGKLYTT